MRHFILDVAVTAVALTAIKVYGKYQYYKGKREAEEKVDEVLNALKNR